MYGHTRRQKGKSKAMRVYQALGFVAVFGCLAAGFVPSALPASQRSLLTRRHFHGRSRPIILPKAAIDASEGLQKTASTLQSLQQTPIEQLKLDPSTINSAGLENVISTISKLDATIIQKFIADNPIPFAAASLLVFGALLSSATTKKLSSPYPNNGYDYLTARVYFQERPGLVLSRAAELLYSSGGFGLSLLLDVLTNSVEANQEMRAKTLTTVLTRLGPTFIKIGQSLSIRTDLLPITYIRALQQVSLVRV